MPKDDKEIEKVPPIVFDTMYDGTGHSIHIPTIVISNEHGEELKKVFDETTWPS